MIKCPEDRKYQAKCPGHAATIDNIKQANTIIRFKTIAPFVFQFGKARIKISDSRLVTFL